MEGRKQYNKKRGRNIERKKLRKKVRVEGTIDKQDVGSTIWRFINRRFIPGNGNSIFLSILPGLIRAGSRLSILFVAMITFTSPLSSKPSS